MVNWEKHSEVEKIVWSLNEFRHLFAFSLILHLLPEKLNCPIYANIEMIRIPLQAVN